MMMMVIDKKLTKIAQSKVRVSLPLILNFILSFILMILSISQSFPVNEAGDGMILGAFFSGWQRNVCHNRMIQFFSPFAFDFKLESPKVDFGLMACPWRIRNTIYRLILICLVIIISLWMLIILYVNKKSSSSSSSASNNKSSNIKGAHIWYLLYWFKYLLFLSWVILFILDCDGAYAGYNACRANFDITGFGPLVLSLLGAAFTTTSAPVWPSGGEISADPGDGTLVITQFKIADQCHITPAIYVLLIDFAIIFMTFLSYKLSKFYKFDNNDDDEDDVYNDDYEGNNPYNSKPKETKKRFRFHKTNKKEKKKKNKKEDEEGENIEKVEKIGKKKVNDNAYGAQSNNPFDTMEDELFEPPSWNKRKPTYEQNYS